MWDTRWQVAAFAIFWGACQVSPSTLPHVNQYPIAAYPHFCAKTEAGPTQPPRAQHMVTDVKLTACTSGALLKSGALVPRRWIELHGGNAATGRCSAAFWRLLTQEVQKNLHVGKRPGTCALFVVQNFALLMDTPLEAQLRRDPPALLVFVNGTAVRAKSRKAKGWWSCGKTVKKLPASASDSSRNHSTVVHKRLSHRRMRPALAQSHGFRSRNHSGTQPDGTPRQTSATSSAA